MGNHNKARGDGDLAFLLLAIDIVIGVYFFKSRIA